ncbi:MAG: hypothetical protein LQ344_007067 [Seirophora lacunosa]|nr:MAG: hypothetical protein LQ344_007067 [Seirophora lacunosa]
MASSASSFDSIPTCYATVSIGTPETPLDKKLEAIAGAGFQGIELGFPDLLSFASKGQNKEVQAQDFDTLCEVGREVKQLVEKNGLRIVMLQPFSNFEGWDEGSDGREDAFRRAKGWIRIMEAVGTDMLQVGSTDSPHALGDLDYLATDLRQLADLLAAKDFCLAYENWCWATHAPDWKDVWEIVQKVDRPNVGLCLDTFQTAGGEWADPTTASGLIEREGGLEALESQFRTSLDIMSRTIPSEKIYILQLSDAYKPKTPLDSKPDDSGLRPRGRWSSCLRPLPFDGGYLPVVDFTKAVLRTGFRGWFSMEVFDGGPEGSDQDWRDMKAYAKKAMASHKRLLEEAAES